MKKFGCFLIQNILLAFCTSSLASINTINESNTSWQLTVPGLNAIPSGEYYVIADQTNEKAVLGKTGTDMLFAVNQTGATVWTFFTGGPVASTPLVYKGRVYIASDDGYIYCLQNGTLLWKFMAALSEQKMINAYNNRIISVWPVRGGPCVYGDSLYFTAGYWPFMGVSLYALNATTGAVAWVNDCMVQWTAQPHGASAFTSLTPLASMTASATTLTVATGRDGQANIDRLTGRVISFGSSGQGGNDLRFNRYAMSGNKDTVLLSKYRVNRPIPLYPPTAKVCTLLTKVGDLIISVNDAGVFYSSGNSQISSSLKTVSLDQVHTLQKRSSINALSDDIIRLSAIKNGYAVILGASDPSLPLGILSKTSCNIVVLESDNSKILNERQQLFTQGFYSKRVAVLETKSLTGGLPKYCANLITVEPSYSTKLTAADFITLFSILRPYTGVMILPTAVLSDAVGIKNSAQLNGATVSEESGYVIIKKLQALAGSGEWNNQFGQAGNTYTSNDKLTNGPLGVSWFGGESDGWGDGPNSIKYDQGVYAGRSCPVKSFHHPVIANGRMFVTPKENGGALAAFDIYTGQTLWTKSGIGSRFAAMDNKLYVLGNEVTVFNAETGAQLQTVIPSIGTTKEFRLWSNRCVVSGTNGVCGIDRGTNQILWTRLFSGDAVANDGVWYHHPSNFGFAVGKNLAFCIYSIASKDLKTGDLTTGITETPTAQIIALDVSTGLIKWNTVYPNDGTKSLQYLEDSDILILSDQGRGHGVNENNKNILIRSWKGSDGTVLWQRTISHYSPLLTMAGNLTGQYNFTLISPQTGYLQKIVNPITREEFTFNWQRQYGCNYAVGSYYTSFVRSGTAAYVDSRSLTGIVQFGGIRSGCTTDLIPACGVVTHPNLAAGCICNYPIYTSLGLVNCQDAQMWGKGNIPYTADKIQRIGINFGAPGQRGTISGTMWYEYPVRTSQQSHQVTITPTNCSYFYMHEPRVNGGVGYRWVQGSGILGAEKIEVPLSIGKSYRARLYFCEPENIGADTRVFDVRVNESSPVRIDPVKDAGASHRGLIKEFSFQGSLRIVLSPIKGKTLLNGIEIAESSLGFDSSITTAVVNPLSQGTNFVNPNLPIKRMVKSSLRAIQKGLMK